MIIMIGMRRLLYLHILVELIKSRLNDNKYTTTDIIIITTTTGIA